MVDMCRQPQSFQFGYEMAGSAGRMQHYDRFLGKAGYRFWAQRHRFGPVDRYDFQVPAFDRKLHMLLARQP